MTSMMKMVRTKFEIQTNMSAQLKMIYMHESMQVPAFSTQTSTQEKNTKFSTFFSSITFTRSKYSIFVSFFFFAFNSNIPTTFSLENVFLYCMPKKKKVWTGHLTSHPRLNPPPHTARRWSTYGWQWMMTGTGRWVWSLHLHSL